MRTLREFRNALTTLCCAGAPLDARDRLVVVPTRAAAAHLISTIENRMLADFPNRPRFPATSPEPSSDLPTSNPAFLLPDLVTPREMVARLAERLPPRGLPLTRAEREALLGVACRAARADGLEPPFRLRPGLLAEILRFYDTLRRNQRDVDAFERLALGMLEPGAAYDRGAERLVRQTRFLAAAFRIFERRSASHGYDEHSVRERLVAEPSPRPYRHVVLAVGDRGFDPHGLYPADWDLLGRIPGLERLDLVVTDTVLAGALHERLHRVLPGVDEVRFDAEDASADPVLVVPPGGAAVTTARDREEEVAAFARAVKHGARSGRLRALDRAALVVRHPLPYVYIAREVFDSGGLPCQMFDALPLAAEPYAAALDLICAVVASDFARVPAIALLRSPHFDFAGRFDAADETRERGATAPGAAAREVAALDRALAEAGYLGQLAALERLVDRWRSAESSESGDVRRRASGRTARAVRAAERLLSIGRELAPLLEPAPTADHLDVLARFLAAHEVVPVCDDASRARHLRARAAILASVGELRDAYARFDSEKVGFDDVAALVRRRVEAQTFSPRAGRTGVHLVDAASAPFGDFDEVLLAGLVDGEWPDRPRRSVFYPAGLLQELGWPAESLRRDAERAAFADLLRLPAARLSVSTFSLEADAIVSPSILLDELDAAGLDAVEDVPPPRRIFEHEALALDPVDLVALSPQAREWAAARLDAARRDDPRFRGATLPPDLVGHSLSSLERYQDCPFKFFASDVLRLEEAPQDESTLSPRARGRFIHEVFQRFFEAWDREASGPIDPARFDEARRVFAEVAEPLLSRLPESDAVLERTRLFGSAISVGVVDLVLGLEAARPVAVQERWLEYPLEGDFFLGRADGRRVSLRGVTDRVDLLAGNRLRVIDYKSGSAPNVKRALQVPVYALCAQERLTERDGQAWHVDEAAYIALSGKRVLVPVVKAGGADATAALDGARQRVYDVLDGIASGEFPPRPHDLMMCRYCAYPAVCRKDYVEDE